MNTKPIISTFLDDDAYTSFVGSAIYHYHPNLTATYGHTLRSKDVDLSVIYHSLLDQVAAMGEISLSDSDAEYLRSIGVSDGYVQWLSEFRFDPSQLVISLDSAVNGGLSVRSADGTSALVGSKWEMPVLAVISELYWKSVYGGDAAYAAAENRAYDVLKDKVSWLKRRMVEEPDVDYGFTEFGTRRRFSRKFQADMVQYLSDELQGVLRGTSNLKLAKELGLRPVGTQSHQWYMIYQALSHFLDSQAHALRDWVDYYPNGIVLTDTLGSDMWERDFTVDYMRKTSGQRHDSADPFTWAERRIAAYVGNNIDPMTKTLLFSDNLNFEKSFALSRMFGKRTNVSHGIGTFLSCDLGEGYPKALSQVYKVLYVNDRPVAKLSDDMELKAQCPCPVTLNYAINSVRNIK